MENLKLNSALCRLSSRLLSLLVSCALSIKSEREEGNIDLFINNHKIPIKLVILLLSHRS